MEVWLEARPVRLTEAREVAELARDSGADGVALNEVKCPPDLAAAVMFAHVPDLRIVTSMLIAFPRSPMVAAYNAWQLHHLSGGRFELGLGTQVKGHIERRFGVAWAPPKPRMKEYMESVRATWRRWESGEELDFRGEHYNITLMTDDFDPGPIGLPMPMIQTSAINEGMCRLAGEASDGVIMAEPITKKFTETVMLPSIHEGLAKAGRERDDLTITGGGYIGVGEPHDIEEVREHIRYRIAFYSSTRTYRRPLELHGWEHVSEPLHELSVAGRWSEMSQHVTDDMVDEFAVIGTYDDVAEKIVDRYQGIADRVYVGPFLSRSVTPSNVRKLVNAIKRIS